MLAAATSVAASKRLHVDVYRSRGRLDGQTSGLLLLMMGDPLYRQLITLKRGQLSHISVSERFCASSYETDCTRSRPTALSSSLTIIRPRGGFACGTSLETGAARRFEYGAVSCVYKICMNTTTNARCCTKISVRVNNKTGLRCPPTVQARHKRAHLN